MADEPAYIKLAVQQGIISEAQLQECLVAQQKAHEATGVEISLEQFLLKKQYLTNDQLKTLLKASGAGGKSPIEDYEIIKKLGEGGMGAVYLARKTAIERLCALKVLPPKLAKSDQDFAERFLREARSVAKLSHPNIVIAYDTGKSGEYYFFAMEFVDGQSLSDLIKQKGKLSEAEALPLFMGVARGLAHAASKGMVHRDIKPDNILIKKDGTPKIADFGLAKTKGQTHLTQTGTSMGTPSYISPEQAQGQKEIDSRADIYSLGCTLFHAVCGRTPFEKDSALSVIMAHCEEPLPNPKTFAPELSDGLCFIIKKMCAKKPDKRYQSCDELLADLEKVSRGETINVPIAPAKPAPPKAVPAKTESERSERVERPERIDRSDRSNRSERSVRSSRRNAKSATPLVVGIVGVIALIAVIVFFALGSRDNNNANNVVSDNTKERETKTPVSHRTKTPSPTVKPDEDEDTTTPSPIDTPRQTPPPAKTTTPPPRATVSQPTPTPPKNEGSFSPEVIAEGNALIAQCCNDINGVNNSDLRQTPLHLAAKQGNPELVKYLLSKGANINAGNIFDGTPLIVAVEKGHAEVVEILIDNGADIKASRIGGVTVWSVAKNDNIRRILLKNSEKK